MNSFHFQIEHQATQVSVCAMCVTGICSFTFVHFLLFKAGLWIQSYVSCRFAWHAHDWHFNYCTINDKKKRRNLIWIRIYFEIYTIKQCRHIIHQVYWDRLTRVIWIRWVKVFGHRYADYNCKKLILLNFWWLLYLMRVRVH